MPGGTLLHRQVGHFYSAVYKITLSHTLRKGEKVLCYITYSRNRSFCQVLSLFFLSASYFVNPRLPRLPNKPLDAGVGNPVIHALFTITCVPIICYKHSVSRSDLEFPNLAERPSTTGKTAFILPKPFPVDEISAMAPTQA